MQNANSSVPQAINNQVAAAHQTTQIAPAHQNQVIPLQPAHQTTQVAPAHQTTQVAPAHQTTQVAPAHQTTQVAPAHQTTQVAPQQTHVISTQVIPLPPAQSTQVIAVTSDAELHKQIDEVKKLLATEVAQLTLVDKQCQDTLTKSITDVNILKVAFSSIMESLARLDDENKQLKTSRDHLIASLAKSADEHKHTIESLKKLIVDQHRVKVFKCTLAGKECGDIIRQVGILKINLDVDAAGEIKLCSVHDHEFDSATTDIQLHVEADDGNDGIIEKLVDGQIYVKDDWYWLKLKNDAYPLKISFTLVIQIYIYVTINVFVS